MLKKLLIDSALKTQGIVSTTKNPYVLLRDLSNCFITYEINAYTNQPNNLIWIKGDLINNMLDEFKQAVIEIVSPIHVAVRDCTRTMPPMLSPLLDTTKTKQQ